MSITVSTTATALRLIRARVMVLCIAFQAITAPVLFADDDEIIVPLLSWPRFELPEPYKRGEILAKVSCPRVSDDEETTLFLSMEIEAGTLKFEVPQEALALFPGADLCTLQLFAGPPEAPDFPVDLAKPNPGEPPCLTVTFLCHAWPRPDGENAEDGTTGVLVFKEGKLIALYSSQREERDSVRMYHTKDYDPVTYKEIARRGPAKDEARLNCTRVAPVPQRGTVR